MLLKYTWCGKEQTYCLIKVGMFSAVPKLWLRWIEENIKKGIIMNEVNQDKKQDKAMEGTTQPGIPQFLKRNQDGSRQEEQAPKETDKG